MSNLKRFKRSEEFKREERLPSPVMVDGEEEHQAEAILRHKGKGVRRLYLVMWKEYPIIEASPSAANSLIASYSQSHHQPLFRFPLFRRRR